MGAMSNVYDIATEVIFGSFKNSQRDPYVYNWINTRYARIWNGFEWAFKIVEPTLVTTLAGSRYLGAAGATHALPADFGAIRQLLDDQGDEVMYLEEAEFNREYMRARLNGVQGRPERYTIVNRKVVLGPVPDQSYSFYVAYKRLLGFDKGDVAGGTGTFQPGLMGSIDVTKDKPYWPPEHWEAIVIGARATGAKLINDLAWFALEQQHDDLVAGMVGDDLLMDDASGVNRQWGRDIL